MGHHTRPSWCWDYVRELTGEAGDIGHLGSQQNDIGIITPDRKQVQRIGVLLKAKGYDAVQVGVHNEWLIVVAEGTGCTFLLGNCGMNWGGPDICV